MKRKLIEAFPKLAIAIGVFVLSTGMFAFWWFTRSSGTSSGRTQYGPPVEDVRQQIAATLPAKIGWLALVGTDLYDISTGELLLAGWMNGVPQKLFYQPGTNKLMVHAERGVMRYGLDGRKDATMGENSPPAFSEDGKRAMYIRDGDLWLAEVDWKAFRLLGERQATKGGQFNPNFFASQLQLFTENSLITGQGRQFLHVDLKQGDIRQVKLPDTQLIRRRSPDGGVAFGEQAGKLVLFDCDTSSGTPVPNVKQRALDFRWMGNSACAFIHNGGASVALYDRKRGTTSEITKLPFPCEKLAGPSPDGRYVLCAGRRGIAVVDLKSKAAREFGLPAQHFGWVSDDTLIYTRDVPDTTTRGVLLQTMGQPEQQVLGDPYTVGRDGGAAVCPMLQIGEVVFGTRNALYRMKPDGSELKEIAKLKRPVGRIQAVEIWGE